MPKPKSSAISFEVGESVIFPPRPKEAKAILRKFLELNPRPLCVGTIDALGWWALPTTYELVEDGIFEDLGLQECKSHRMGERFFCIS